jgi:hypothetical protein
LSHPRVEALDVREATKAERSMRRRLYELAETQGCVPTEIVMGLLAGIELLTFTGISFGVEPPVIDPGDFGPIG